MQLNNWINNYNLINTIYTHLSIEDEYDQISRTLNSMINNDIFWLCESDCQVDFKYVFFTNYSQIANDLFSDYPYESPNDFLQSHYLDEKYPIIRTNYGRQYYMFKTRDSASTFLSVAASMFPLPEDE